MEYILPAIIGFLLSLIGILFALKYFPRLQLLDKPEKYGLTRKPIPYFGGLILYLAFFLTVFLFVDFDMKLWGVFVASTILIFVNFWDDLKALKWYFRLPVQFLVAVIVLATGTGILEISNPLGGVVLLNQIILPIDIFSFHFDFIVLADSLVILWIVVMMNAMNWMDGVNGLPSGLAIISALAIFFLSRENFHLVDQSVVSNLSIILVFVCLAFWLFDFYPAKILMGDTGSMFLGFIIAVLAVLSGAKIATTALVLGFPLLDFVWTILRRVLVEKKSPFKGDLKHLHHRFIKAGFTERQTLFAFYFICTAFGAIALFTSNSTQKLVAILIMVFCMVILGGWVVVKGRD
ncbi:hypothetical protein A2335_02055 [Candidatus Peregrinibacteria bacterium RIFOXYB2_FULL_32_7]|nr:MAG: hypothetical protein A2335_02055 [Candidatus Peregrinibacteria bacterium RIFOXYB2_FULL_32_7]